MKLSNVIAGQLTAEEYKMIREEKHEKLLDYLEKNSVPIPEAFVKICNMIKVFDYSREHAGCIEKYIRQYVIVSILVNCDLRSMLYTLADGLNNIQLSPEREIYVELAISDRGIHGGVYEKITEEES